MQPNKKQTERYAVIFFNIAGVEVPKSESPESDPNEAPRPVLLLSCIKITQHKITDKNKKRNTKR
jgi:hypothetical protein